LQLLHHFGRGGTEGESSFTITFVRKGKGESCELEKKDRSRQLIADWFTRKRRERIAAVMKKKKGKGEKEAYDCATERVISAPSAGKKGEEEPKRTSWCPGGREKRAAFPPSRRKKKKRIARGKRYIYPCRGRKETRNGILYVSPGKKMGWAKRKPYSQEGEEEKELLFLLKEGERKGAIEGKTPFLSCICKKAGRGGGEERLQYI